MISLPKTSKKVILLGHFGVGKTSLVKRFVYSKFSEEYLTTIGVKIDKKEVEVGQHLVNMIIWDIEGGAVQSKLPKSYFLGANGIIYVFDLTRPSTYANIAEELSFFTSLLPKAKVQVVGNKRDLLDDVEMKEVEATLNDQFDHLSSAKTGENVDLMFQNLGELMLA